MKQSCFFSLEQVFITILRSWVLFYYCFPIFLYCRQSLISTHTVNLIGEFIIIYTVYISGTSQWYRIEQAQSYKCINWNCLGRSMPPLFNYYFPGIMHSFSDHPVILISNHEFTLTFHSIVLILFPISFAILYLCSHRANGTFWVLCRTEMRSRELRSLHVRWKLIRTRAGELTGCSKAVLLNLPNSLTL